ncbi:MAG: hypothetical protein WCD76_09500 [Pyrinomonadaceae bacterium]
MSREIHLELLLGATVRDANGETVGRIEEVIAERQAGECVVREYLIGRAALLNRLSIRAKGLTGLKSPGVSSHAGYRVPWGKLDLSDAKHPHLTCAKDELKRLD